MAFQGKNPTINSHRYSPLDADPANPQEGDIFYASASHGTKDEGLWLYQDADWQQVSTGANLSTLSNLTLTPQAADPGSPVVGMLYVSNGTPRAAGLWIYTSDGWSQITGVRYLEFFRPAYIQIRAASTTNVTLASQVENGDSFGGVTLVTGNLVLLKDQTTASENGVYVVQASGAPVRHSSADTFEELNDYCAYILSGTHANTRWYQTATLTSLSDNQVWATTPATKSFTVPAGVYELPILGTGGGGAGGTGSIYTPAAGFANGGSGGGGSIPTLVRQAVTPGQVLTITLGKGGQPGAATSGSSVAGTAGGAGANTTITGTGITLTFTGAPGGAGGTNASSTPSTPTAATFTELGSTSSGGSGSAGTNVNVTPAAGSAAGTTIYAAGGAGGTGATSSGVSGGAGNGGGGGASIVSGGAGGSGGTRVTPSQGADAVKGSGGGGAGAASENGGNVSNIRSGIGGDGYVRISW